MSTLFVEYFRGENMNTPYIRIKELADEKKVSIAEIERKLDFSSGLIGKWKTAQPSADKLAAVADYFHVSTDYLMGRTTDQNIQTTQPDERPKLQKIARNASKLNDEDLDRLDQVMGLIFNKAFKKDK
ncbi:helix-turn-helix transcriptional regulator [Lacticaseibacillus paracasei subsp. tolerans]|uniref:helix-turn-helix domain-containing protein n=1 Tax=Lacticaseibacillus paracasei TaxID=1597 RepID=UPI0018929B39|nr:helix-turn-helix transcriptional regulator [Lacticaseibacillus paracasei]QPC21014.1 helix-turn-helix transcriptional regulator [Lacticaseibacillus paracasei subsp. tolerans]WPH55541.1 helix-turn-helix transcriptional regulator [Lacticaseibacillus paracasei]